MFSFLSAEALYGLLLVTTFASVGLLGLWAVMSKWHPFLRTTIVLAILSVLLLRPIFEPFVMLVSQVATIAAGVAVYRWVKNRKNVDTADAKRTRYQFSLKTLLFVSTLVALGAAVVAKLPDIGWQLWLGYFGVGFAAGLGTLGLGMFAAPAKKLWIRFGGLLGAIVFNALAITSGMYALELATDPNHVFGRSGLFLTSAFTPMLLFSQFATILLWQGMNRSESENAQWHHHSFTSLAVLLYALLFALPAYFTWLLVNPLPRPTLNTMKPNVYKDLTALGTRLDQSPLITAFNAYPVDLKRLAQEVANHSAEYKRLDELLEQPSVIPDAMSRDVQPIYERRALAFALYAKGDVARDAGDFDIALQSQLKTLQLVEKFSEGNFSDLSLSSAIEAGGIAGIHHLVSDLDVQQCDLAIKICLDHEKSREPAEESIRRLQQYEENYDGWWGHLLTLLNDLIGEQRLSTSMYNSELQRSQAILSLLVTELAIRKYQLTYNALPETLNQLVPGILSEVPLDPFDPEGKTLKYKRTNDGYILYSVSRDGVDNGGVPPTGSDSQWWYEDSGDLRLDHYFAEPEPETTQDSDVDLGQPEAEESQDN